MNLWKLPPAVWLVNLFRHGAKYRKLRLILGDQLNIRHSWFKEKDSRFCTCSWKRALKPGTSAITFKSDRLLPTMRAFADELREKLPGPHPAGRQGKPTIHQQQHQKLVSQHGIRQFEYLLPDEYRLDEELKPLPGAGLRIRTFRYRALSNPPGWQPFRGQKTYLLELLLPPHPQTVPYSDGRRRRVAAHHRWNYDQENRKKAAQRTKSPNRCFQRDVSGLAQMLRERRWKPSAPLTKNSLPNEHSARNAGTAEPLRTTPAALFGLPGCHVRAQLPAVPLQAFLRHERQMLHPLKSWMPHKALESTPGEHRYRSG